MPIFSRKDIDAVRQVLESGWILAADDIIRYYLAQNPEAFEFILLADQSSNPEDFNAVIQTHGAGLKALYKLMDVQTP